MIESANGVYWAECRRHKGGSWEGPLRTQYSLAREDEKDHDKEEHV